MSDNPKDDKQAAEGQAELAEQDEPMPQMPSVPPPTDPAGGVLEGGR